MALLHIDFDRIGAPQISTRSVNHRPKSGETANPMIRAPGGLPSYYEMSVKNVYDALSLDFDDL